MYESHPSRHTLGIQLGSWGIHIYLCCILVIGFQRFHLSCWFLMRTCSRTICRAAREREERTMKTIVEKFPERNIKLAQQRAERRRQEEALGVSSISTTSSSNTSSLSLSSSEGQKPPFSWLSWFRGSSGANGNSYK